MQHLLFIQWNVDPVLVEIGPLAIRWYGLLFMFSFLFGYKILENVFKRESVKLELLDKLAMYVGLGTIIGARLGHCLFYQADYYLSHPIEIIMIHQGGLASHGAAFGIIIGMYLFCRKHKTTFLWIADRVVMVVALAATFIRIGNLMNSEIVGQPTDGSWGFIFQRLHEIPPVPRHPTQLYEASYYLLVFGVLQFLYWKKNSGQIPGRIFGIFLLMVFGFRFFVEFLKENQVDFEGGLPLNMGQWLSIPFIAFAIYLLRKPKTSASA